MFKQLSTFIEIKISQYLCGFRKGYNTQHALMKLFDKLNKNIDKGIKVGIFMMDLSKAFDCISHNLLIGKLHAYGLDKPSLKLIYSYLKGRKQKVKINSDFSTWKDVINGVPQGSVLGPLLFNIFINDLFLLVLSSDICNFADDNTLSIADISIDEIINRLGNDIDIIQTWFQNNGMLLNETKCQFLIIESSRSKRAESASLKVLNETIYEKNDGKILGIMIDNNIKYEETHKEYMQKSWK